MKLYISATLITVCMLGAIGCNGEPATPEPNNSQSTDSQTTGHDHPSHGPHDGDLIELGGEDYHAELVHGDDDEIVIYILGSDAKTAVPIDAEELVVNVMHDGNPEQFKLTASADEGDPEGKSSRFISSDKELSEHVHDDTANAKLVVMIEGKQHTGKIPHDDDHGHSHD